MPRKELKNKTFHGLGIAPGLLKRIKTLGFQHPTPIQHKAIPVATSGEDVVGVAQTGSGKTLAFSIPMLQKIMETNRIGLVLLPTRELAVQVEETLRKIAKNSNLKTARVIGGTNPRPPHKQLKAKPHVIVATPGRLIDHMQSRHVQLSKVGILILDEADRMLDMGFEPQLKKILASVPANRQTMLFSATMPPKIAELAKQYMRKPLRIEVAKPGTTADKIDQEMIIVPRQKKKELLASILKQYEGSALVFSRTKHGAKKIARDIRAMGFTADEIHSNRTQNQRQRALKGFASGRFRILVATDIAARGIDVDHVKLVVNYDLPDQLDDYVHRIGRTGRAGREGKAISFAAPEQKRDIVQIEKLINMTLNVTSHDGEKVDLNRNTSSKKRNARQRRRSNSRRGRSNSKRRPRRKR